MSDEFNKSGCAPSDCASCTANCESKVDEAHHTITLTMDDDTEVECGIIGVFDVDGKEYIALLPINDETVLIYEYKEVGDEVELGLIEDDEEFEKISNAFYDLYEDEDEDEE